MGTPLSEIEANLASTEHVTGDWLECSRSEACERRVVITEPFYLSACEITVNQFR